MTTKAKATVEDLYRVPEHGKAELVNGNLVVMSPTGFWPSRAAFTIAISLRQHEAEQGGGVAIGDNPGFLVDLPNRQSFCPDAAWYVEPVVETDMKFLQGAPAFAVEVRSENDYGPKEDRAILQKIADYFAAGAQVVWDVDLQSEEVIKKYHAADPEHPTIFRRGDLADAEPAVPGWTFAVDSLFAARRQP